MEHDQRITISYPESECPDHETTWGEFIADNDLETIASVEPDLTRYFYAEIGGGASPRVWIFA